MENRQIFKHGNEAISLVTGAFIHFTSLQATSKNKHGVLLATINLNT